MVRRGHGGERVELAGGVIVAAYRHRMSRALDPQLHTHVVAANLAQGSDGRFTALHGTALYRAAKTAGYLYQSHLRALVGERLGLEWGNVTKGAAELIRGRAARARALLKAPPRDAPRGRGGRYRFGLEGSCGERGPRHARAQAVRRRDPHLARGGARPCR